MNPRFWVFWLSRLGALLTGLWLSQGAIVLAGDGIGLDFSLPTYQAGQPMQSATQSSIQPSARYSDPISLSPASSSDFPKEATIATGAAQPTIQHLPFPRPFNQLFAGGADSLVARAIGSAEGTRMPSGEKTIAYYGHVDPGNGAWNVGSFSYQHGAKSPEEADEKQLARLQQQAQELGSQASDQGLELTIEEKLNGLDLANQAPLAALAEDGGGYVDRLQQAREMGLRDAQAILWARTYAYLDPTTNQWNAPGLGNTLDGISQDQQRRLQAVARAIASDPQVLPESSGEKVIEPPKTIAQPSSQSIKQALNPPPPKPVELDLQPTAPKTEQSIQDQVTEEIIFQDL